MAEAHVERRRDPRQGRERGRGEVALELADVPFVSPVASASCGIVIPRSFLSARSRLPTGTSTIRPSCLVVLTCRHPPSKASRGCGGRGSSPRPGGMRSGEAGTPTTSGADSPPAGDVGALEGVARIHPDPWHDVSEADFERRPTSLATRYAELQPDERLVELMRLLALLGERDGQRNLSARPRARKRAEPASRASLRVRRRALRRGRDRSPRPGRCAGESIGGVPVDEVRALVEPLVPRDNESSLTARVPQFLLVAEVLHGLGVTISADEAELELVSPGGRRESVRWSRCRPPPTARRSPISSTARSAGPPLPARASVPRTAPRGALVVDAGRRQGRLRRLQRHPREHLRPRGRAPSSGRPPRGGARRARPAPQPGRGQHDLWAAAGRARRRGGSRRARRAHDVLRRANLSPSSRSAPTRYSSASPREGARTSTATRSPWRCPSRAGRPRSQPCTGRRRARTRGSRSSPTSTSS